MEFIKLGVEYVVQYTGNEYSYTRATFKQIIMGVDGVPIMLISNESTIFNWQNIIAITETATK